MMGKQKLPTGKVMLDYSPHMQFLLTINKTRAFKESVQLIIKTPMTHNTLGAVGCIYCVNQIQGSDLIPFPSPISHVYLKDNGDTILQILVYV